MASYKHIFISGNVNSEKYKAQSKPNAKPSIPTRDRATQSQKLLNQFAEIFRQKEQQQQQRSAEQIATREGTYIQFTSAADHDLITKSLEDLRKGYSFAEYQRDFNWRKSIANTGNGLYS